MVSRQGQIEFANTIRSGVARPTVIDARAYALKIAGTTILSNLTGYFIYRLRSRAARESVQTEATR